MKCSSRTVCSVPEEAPHRIVEERVFAALDSSKPLIRRCLGHHRMQPSGFDNAFIEWVHVEVSTQNGSAVLTPPFFFSDLLGQHVGFGRLI
ncbi:MAG: hypothetical protein CMJ64_22505 [Planctomycetaceae bacterium]|nr:hypothetical protein [Planctomycetaceae bacterium]